MQKLTKPVFLSILFLIIFTSFSCNTTEPPPPPPPTPVAPKTIKLELLDVTFTEAYIKVEALTDTILPAQINLKKNNLLLYTFTLAGKDTVITDTTLQANTSYSYQAVRVENGTESDDRSDTLTVKTLNTTSNNFTWQTYTIGEHSSSVLNDVAIIDENNIWVVGEIYMNDSTGQPDPHAYCLAHWDGSKWELKKLYDLNNQLIPSLRGIYYFGPNDIWLADGGVYRWDGISLRVSASYSRIFLIGGVENGQSVNKLWGTDSNNIYGVGYKGMIAHFSNGYWEKIESGTSTNINDVWGNSSLVLATVTSRYQTGDYKLLSINPNSSSEYSSWPYTRLFSVWFNSERDIYVVGSGAYQYKYGNWSSLNLPTINFLPRIRGSAVNDIYIAGTSGTFFHFNGIQWKSIDGLFGNYEGLSVKGNIAVAAGWTSNFAVVTVIKRK